MLDFIRATSVVLLTALTAGALPAQIQTPTFTALTPMSDLALTWDETAAANLHPDQPGAITLHFKNNSTQTIVLTDLALTDCNAFNPITPISIPAGGSSDYSLSVDVRTVALPSNLAVFFKVQGSPACAGIIPISSLDVLLVSPRFVQWQQGDPLTPKTVQITNIPPGLTVTGVASTSAGFVATLQGNTIAITPTDTTQPQLATVTLLTAQPISRPAGIAVQVGNIAVPTN